MRNVPLIVLAFAVLAAAGCLATAAASENQDAPMVESDRLTAYTDWRLTAMPLPKDAKVSVERDGGGQPPGAFTKTPATKTPVRLTLGFLESENPDRGAGVMLSGLSVSHELFIDSTANTSDRFRVFMLDGEIGYARRLGSRPVQFETGVMLGLGVATVHSTGYRDSNGLERDTKGMGWAYDVGLRAGLAWTLSNGFQVFGDARYLYHQFATNTVTADPAGNIGMKQTVTFSGPAFAFGVGWRF